VLIVEDAHLLDPPSATLVHLLVREGATLRTGEPVPSPVASLWTGDLLEHAEPPPLTDEELPRPGGAGQGQGGQRPEWSATQKADRTATARPLSSHGDHEADGVSVRSCHAETRTATATQPFAGHSAETDEQATPSR
jgi:hypothetical protein